MRSHRVNNSGRARADAANQAINDALRQQLLTRVKEISRRDITRLGPPASVGAGFESNNWDMPMVQARMKREVLAQWAQELEVSPRTLEERMSGRTSWQLKDLIVAIRWLDEPLELLAALDLCDITVAPLLFRKRDPMRPQIYIPETIDDMSYWEAQKRARRAGQSLLAALSDYEDSLKAIKAPVPSGLAQASSDVLAGQKLLFRFTAERSLSQIILHIVQEYTPVSRRTSEWPGIPQRVILSDLEVLYGNRWNMRIRRGAIQTLSRLVRNRQLERVNKNYRSGPETLRRHHKNRLDPQLST